MVIIIIIHTTKPKTYTLMRIPEASPRGSLASTPTSPGPSTGADNGCVHWRPDFLSGFRAFWLRGGGGARWRIEEFSFASTKGFRGPQRIRYVGFRMVEMEVTKYLVGHY